MTLSEWQSNPKLAAWSAETFGSPTGRLWIEMMTECHPKNMQLPHTVSDSVKSTELGRIYGYDQCINNIEASKIVKAPQPKLAETFGAKLEQPDKAGKSDKPK